MVVEQARSVSTVLDKVRTRGYWWVVIHPSKFEDSRVSVGDLFPLVESCVVRLRGWPYPSVGEESLRRDSQWVDHETDLNHIVEYWRMDQSGQFVDYKGLRSDWLDQSGLYPAWSGWQPGQFLTVEDVVLSTTEIFAFAARLALTAPYRTSTYTYVALTLRGMYGRTLTSTSRQELQGRYPAIISEFPQSHTLMREALIADTRSLAVNAAREVCAQFGLNALPEVLRDLQEGTAR